MDSAIPSGSTLLRKALVASVFVIPPLLTLAFCLAIYDLSLMLSYQYTLITLATLIGLAALVATFKNIKTVVNDNSIKASILLVLSIFISYTILTGIPLAIDISTRDRIAELNDATLIGGDQIELAGYFKDKIGSCDHVSAQGKAISGRNVVTLDGVVISLCALQLTDDPSNQYWVKTSDKVIAISGRWPFTVILETSLPE
jgi:hypothetical protein